MKHRYLSLLVLLFALSGGAQAAKIIYAIANGGLYRSADSGQTWQSMTGTPVGASFYALILDPTNSSVLYGVGYDNAKAAGAFWGTRDAGQTWSESLIGASISLARIQMAIDPVATNFIYLAGETGFFKSSDSGKTWSRAGFTGPVSSVTTDPKISGVVWAFVAGTNFFKSTDFGASFVVVPAKGDASLANLRNASSGRLSIDPRDSNVMYAALQTSCSGGGSPAGACGVFKSIDGGLNWKNLNQPGTFRNVSFDLRTGAIYAGGANSPVTGNIIKSLDGGATWTALNNGITATGMEVYVDPDDSSKLYAFQSSPGFFQGTAPGLFLSTDGGASWKLQTVASRSFNGAIQGYDVYGIALVAANPPPAAGSVASIVSAASMQAGPVAAESIVIATGSHIATGTATADIDQPPTTLAGTTVNVTDSAGITRPAALFSVSETQVTYQIPPGTAAGTASVTITAGDGVTGSVPVQVAAVAPGVYTLNAAGLVKAFVIRVSNGNQFVEDVYEIDPTGAVIARPITVSNGDQVYLIVYGTGFRAAGADVSVAIGGDSPPVLYAGPQGVAVGVDQFNILIPPDLAAGGQQTVSLILTAAGQAANTVNLTVK